MASVDLITLYVQENISLDSKYYKSAMFDINVKYAQTIKKLDDVFEKGENITKKIEDLIRQEAMIKWRLNDIPINEKEKLNTKMIEIKIKIKKMINQRCL